MCAIALALIGTAVSAIGQMAAASAQAKAANYQAQIANMNAQIQEENAKSRLDASAREEQQHRLKVAMLRGNQRAAMAANNVDLASGSPLEVLVDTAYAGEMDALSIRKKGADEAYNYRVEAANLRAQSQLYRMEAKSARTGGMLSALGTLAGGFGDAIGKYGSTFGKTSVGALA